MPPGEATRCMDRRVSFPFPEIKEISVFISISNHQHHHHHRTWFHYWFTWLHLFLPFAETNARPSYLYHRITPVSRDPLESKNPYCRNRKGEFLSKGQATYPPFRNLTTRNKVKACGVPTYCNWHIVNSASDTIHPHKGPERKQVRPLPHLPTFVGVQSISLTRTIP
jgi:hypothetical protein